MKFYWIMVWLMVWLLGGTGVPRAQASEHLSVPQLPGWKQVDEQTAPGLQTNSLIPKEETSLTWHQRLTVQAYTNTALSAVAFLQQMDERIGETCEGFRASSITSFWPNGHEAGRRLVECGRYGGDGLGMVTLYYTIRGQQALYVLARTWRGQAFRVGQDQPVAPSELARWNATFDKVRLCDSGMC